MKTKYKLIGRGAFTFAYLQEDGKVFLQSRCGIKECMSLGWFPDSSLFPKMERIGASEREGFQDYLMEYYPRVKSLKKALDPDQYKIYRDLRELGIMHFDHESKFDKWHKQFDTLENEELRETMKEALDACANYGSDIQFEISPRNVSAKNGKLILMDCFFIESLLGKK